MCRLLGYQGPRPVRLDREILDLPNALIRQSACDRDVCKPNEDGWGFGYDEGGLLQIVKKPNRAHADPEFARIARRPFRRMMLHIRRASVGDRTETNTHPWSYGGELIFAHNGSVYGFDRIRREAMASLPEPLRGNIRGETDSEFAMHVFLKHFLAVDRLDSGDLQNFRKALSAAVVELRQWSERANADKPPKLNFMLLTRRWLIATRVIHTLGWYRRDRAAVIASEPLDDNDGWRALEENTLAAVTSDGTLETHRLEVS